MKIRISNSNWDIKVVDQSDSMLQGSFGLTIYREQLILISNNLTQDETVNVLMHELTHAMLGESGFNPSIKDRLGDELYEIFVDALSKCIRNVFIDSEEFKEILKIKGE